MTPKEVIPKVQQDLFTMQDLKYRDFHAKLMPTVEKESVYSSNPRFAESEGEHEAVPK